MLNYYLNIVIMIKATSKGIYILYRLLCVILLKLYLYHFLWNVSYVCNVLYILFAYCLGINWSMRYVRNWI